MAQLKEGMEGNALKVQWIFSSFVYLLKIYKSDRDGQFTIYSLQFWRSTKVTVMDRLVAELAGIETALVSLQDQVG